MRESLLIAVLITAVAVCEIMDMVSKILYDYFSRLKKVNIFA